jgi:hypothetical protein
MINHSRFLYLMALVLGALVLAGCTTSNVSPGGIKPTLINSESSAVNTTTLPDSSEGMNQFTLSTTTNVPCSGDNAGLYINISPIPDHHLGDTVFFAGTTNLPAGEMVWVQIGTPPHSCQKYSFPCEHSEEVTDMCCTGNGFNRELTIKQGSCGRNTWSLIVNTSNYDYDFRQGEYILSVESSNHTSEQGALFNIL